MGISRRTFFQWLGASTALSILPGTSEAATAGEELATVLDISQCVGCGSCVEACREVNQAKYPRPHSSLSPHVP